MLKVRSINEEIVFEVRGSRNMELPELIGQLFAQIDEKSEKVTTVEEILLLRHRISDLAEIIVRFHPEHDMIYDLASLDSSLLCQLKELNIKQGGK